jgi:hypothetical protein
LQGDVVAMDIISHSVYGTTLQIKVLTCAPINFLSNLC